jgi:hypothetical protein
MIEERGLRWNREKDRANGTRHALPTADREEKTRGTLRVISNSSPLYNETLLSLERGKPWRCSFFPRSDPLQEVNDQVRDDPNE